VNGFGKRALRLSRRHFQQIVVHTLRVRGEFPAAFVKAMNSKAKSAMEKTPVLIHQGQ
jgi:hypothetical protein